MSEENIQDTETQNKTQDSEKKETPKIDSEAIREALKKEIETAVIEKIRKEEKDKLYPQIEELQKKLVEKDSAVDAAQKAVKDYEEKNLTAEEKTNKLLQELVQTNETLKNQVEEVRVQAEKRVRDAELKSFKKDVVGNYQGEIIEGLVYGTSEDELVTRAENAHKAYLEIKAKVEKEEVEKKLKTPVGTNINPGETDRKVKGIDLTDINKVNTNDEWQKVRSELLAKAGIRA